MTGRSAEWENMQSAPCNGVPIVILVYDNGGHLRPFIGEWDGGGWICRVPGSSEKFSVLTLVLNS
jgi:hypothetical protein